MGDGLQLAPRVYRCCVKVLMNFEHTFCTHNVNGFWMDALGFNLCKRNKTGGSGHAIRLFKYKYCLENFLPIHDLFSNL